MRILIAKIYKILEGGYRNIVNPTGGDWFYRGE